ncbi:hypothetical protein [Alteribacillus bidgolensis]|uniref:Uncharacterized protein n=1 Tax=Alteribacillus bidgolensis TaxID=930129 RepID=A0A1G8PP58_9BACI|nr:hypothetical protein [Alteribacillus bidgolensis]SDI94339.1 hypothetical protein SAMN05216352_11560 [Alteribacillus bidgolensis]
MKGVVEETEKQVCHVNMLQFDRMYHTYIHMEDVEHSELLFIQQLQLYGEELCPLNGIISYEERRTQCDIHPRDEEDSEEDNNVPYI